MFSWYFLPGFKSIGILVWKKFKIDFQDGDWWPSWISSLNNFSYFFIYKSSWYCLPSFESIGISVQKKFKIHFQYGNRGGHLGFPIGLILAIFDLQVTPILPTKFWVSWLSVQKEKFKMDLQDGGHIRFPIRTISTILNLQVALIFPTKFQLALLFIRRSLK